MNFVKDYLVRRNNQKRRKNVLTEFVQNIYTADGLNLDTSRENLEQAVIELVYNNNQHAACGLLITTDGYFVTCYHCVDTNEQLYIVLPTGKKYPIQKVCAFSKKYDIALVKADIPVLSQALCYRFFVHNKLDRAVALEKDIVVVLTRWEKRLVVNGGFTDGAILKQYNVIRNTDYAFVDQVHFQAQLKHGDSGGVVISSTAKRVYGLHSNGERHNNHSFFTAWHKVIELIIYYINRQSSS